MNLAEIIGTVAMIIGLITIVTWCVLKALHAGDNFLRFTYKKWRNIIISIGFLLFFILLITAIVLVI